MTTSLRAAVGRGLDRAVTAVLGPQVPNELAELLPADPATVHKLDSSALLCVAYERGFWDGLGGEVTWPSEADRTSWRPRNLSTG